MPIVNIPLLENMLSEEKGIQWLNEHRGGTAQQDETQARYRDLQSRSSQQRGKLGFHPCLKSACSVLCRVHQPESCRETAKLAASSFGVNVNHSLEAKELEQAERDPVCSVLMALRWKVLEAAGQAQPWHPALCSSHPGIDRAAASGVGLHVSTEMEGIMLTEDLQRLRGFWQVPPWG